MTHEERRKRRVKIVTWVKTHGCDPPAVKSAANEFSVTDNTVRKACHAAELKVKVLPPEPRNHLGPRTFAIIAALINTDDKMCEIAVMMNVSKAWVGDIYARCVESGVPVRVRKRGGTPRP